ncbi:hypothetical protein RvY_09028 [Ramazzottius varieornatus]|uniref:Uncharacterized protein n=1 Tax=Ramazzottius varieornatus TaxID=947166 RepID=A0A1D1V819_RAMVA|nr:hypothetical protein RvY_09028 [Ramazzottius varieornatus]
MEFAAKKLLEHDYKRLFQLNDQPSEADKQLETLVKAHDGHSARSGIESASTELHGEDRILSFATKRKQISEIPSSRWPLDVNITREIRGGRGTAVYDAEAQNMEAVDDSIYQGPNQQRSTPNAATTRAHPDIAARLIAKEVKLNHSVGPFDSSPFPFFVTSSLGLRPKKTGGG